MSAALELDSDGGGFSQGLLVAGSRNVVVAELRYDSGVTVTNRGFTSSSQPDLAVALNVVAERHAANVRVRLPVSAAQVRRRATDPVHELDALPSELRSGFAHAGFVQLTASTSEAAAAALQGLRKSPAVWRATLAPALAPAGTTAQVLTGRQRGSRNLEPSQGHLHAAPNGLDAGAAWRLPGGRGHGIRVCDVEGNWRRSHEDLPRAIPLVGGRPVVDEEWREHGTAVLGALVARPGRVGLHGICPDATALVQSAYYGDEMNAGRALLTAGKHLQAGDVLLLEVQGLGPTGRYVSALWWDEAWSAARSLLDRGIAVVAAAGNGGVDFEDETFASSALQRESPVVLVGAGVPPSNSYDVDGSYRRIGAPRSPMPFSNTGRQVCLQGWGWHLATLGYGDAHSGAGRRWLTLRFAGTSSAAAMVAGAVVCLQGIARQGLRALLQPGELKELLVQTATPQPEGRHIGGQPDLASAVARLLEE